MLTSAIRLVPKTSAATTAAIATVVPARALRTGTAVRPWPGSNTICTPALAGTDLDGKPAEEVLANLSSLPADKQGPVRNNAGGHANHSLFWEIMSPNGGGDPSGSLAAAVNDTFGGLDELKAAVNDAGIKRFGSGWSWLVWDGTGLAVYSTPNQDSPAMKDWDDVPLLGIDVWEHAYYLTYQNRRPEYLEAWWNVVNWEAVAERFHEATRKEHIKTG